jgi:hypothetical protein
MAKRRHIASLSFQCRQYRQMQLFQPCRCDEVQIGATKWVILRPDRNKRVLGWLLSNLRPFLKRDIRFDFPKSKTPTSLGGGG